MATTTKAKPPGKKELLDQLAKCKDADKAHGLRVKLRKLGHKGGLRTA